VEVSGIHSIFVSVLLYCVGEDPLHIDNVGCEFNGESSFLLLPSLIKQDEGIPITIAIQAYLANDEFNPHFFSQYNQNQDLLNIDLFCSQGNLFIIFQNQPQSTPVQISQNVPCVVGKYFLILNEKENGSF
jgi:hypothetical protein